MQSHAHLRHILGISETHLRHISVKPMLKIQTNPWQMSGKSRPSQTISRKILPSLGKPQTYLKPISDKFQANPRQVSGCIAQTHLRKILGIRHISRCLNFALKCTKNVKLSRIFPSNNNEGSVSNPEKFHVNFTASTAYKNSTIPYCQRLLNDHFKTK